MGRETDPGVLSVSAFGADVELLVETLERADVLMKEAVAVLARLDTVAHRLRAAVQGRAPLA